MKISSIQDGCEKRTMCRLCRNRSRGQHVRSLLNIDDCPHGIEWLSGDETTTRPPIIIPPHIRSMEFNDLASKIEAMRDDNGIELVKNQRERINRADCTPCASGAATATLRIWLTKKENDDA